MDWDSIVLGAVHTHDKKAIPAPKSKLSGRQQMTNSYPDIHGGAQENNETLLVSMIDSGITVSVA